MGLLEHRHRGDANGQRSPLWPATGSTGEAPTPTGRPVPAILPPLPLPCREDFCTPTGSDSLAVSYIAEFRIHGLAAANKGAVTVFAGRGRSAFGGEDAGTRAGLPKLAPAAPPLAPTGGDALSLMTG